MIIDIKIMILEYMINARSYISAQNVILLVSLGHLKKAIFGQK